MRHSYDVRMFEFGFVTSELEQFTQASRRANEIACQFTKMDVLIATRTLKPGKQNIGLTIKTFE